MKKGFQSLFIIVVLFSGTIVHSKTPSAIFDAVSSSVVVILSYDANGNAEGLGSGVMLGSNLVATNCHVVKDSLKFQVVHKGKKYSASIQDTDWYRDVCTLKVSDIKAPAVVIGSTLHLKVGTPVYAIGATQGLELTLSEGIISAPRDMIGGRYLQTSVPISPGSSGGGLFDKEGRLIGLTTFNLEDGQKLSFAVPVEWIAELPKQGKKISNVVKTTRVEWTNKTLALNEKRDWAEMIALSLRWIEAQPNEYLAWGSLTEAYEAIGKNAEAIKANQEALSINPKFFSGWYNLGNLYYKSGQNSEAIKAYQHTVSINSEDAGLWFLLGMVYEKTKQYTEAIKANQQALRIDSEDAKVWKSLSIIYEELEQYAEAIKAKQQALRIDPQDALSWYSLGSAYLFSDQFSEAIKSYKQGLRINPEFAEIWFLLGVAYDKSKQYAEAIKAIQQALNINPNYVDAWYSLGIVYAQSNQTSQVMEVYKTLKKLDPEKADEFFNKVVRP